MIIRVEIFGLAVDRGFGAAEQARVGVSAFCVRVLVPDKALWNRATTRYFIAGQLWRIAEHWGKKFNTVNWCEYRAVAIGP
tara:strand:- start:1053 stop:1295 length:243 start_codon:yes stop_codon:yes gene_type:complete